MTKSENLLVSVIIPAYNAEQFIGEAIQSILDQTYQNIEIIIIDDNSSDSTLEVARAYADKDSRIALVHNDTNLGIGANRAKGVAMASGTFICWQDADDISLPTRIAKQVDLLVQHPDVGVVGGWIQFFDDSGEKSIRRYAKTDQKLRAKIFRYSPIAQPASMYRASCFEEVGIYDTTYRLSEDLEMLFRVGEKYQFANVQEVVLKYRQSPTSLTAQNLREMEKATIAIRNSYKSSSAYHYKPFDAIYNILQKATIAMPATLRTKLFATIRGDK